MKNLLKPILGLVLFLAASCATAQPVPPPIEVKPGNANITMVTNTVGGRRVVSISSSGGGGGGSISQSSNGVVSASAMTNLNFVGFPLLTNASGNVSVGQNGQTATQVTNAVKQVLINSNANYIATQNGKGNATAITNLAGYSSISVNSTAIGASAYFQISLGSGIADINTWYSWYNGADGGWTNFMVSDASVLKAVDAITRNGITSSARYFMSETNTFTGKVVLSGAGTPAAGAILTSDSTGNASWQRPNFVLVASNSYSINTNVAPVVLAVNTNMASYADVLAAIQSIGITNLTIIPTNGASGFSVSAGRGYLSLQTNYYTPGTIIPAADASNLTNLNASSLASGIAAPVRLALATNILAASGTYTFNGANSIVARLSLSNTVTVSITNITAGSVYQFDLDNINGTTNQPVNWSQAWSGTLPTAVLPGTFTPVSITAHDTTAGGGFAIFGIPTNSTPTGIYFTQTNGTSVTTAATNINFVNSATVTVLATNRAGTTDYQFIGSAGGTWTQDQNGGGFSLLSLSAIQMTNSLRHYQFGNGTNIAYGIVSSNAVAAANNAQQASLDFALYGNGWDTSLSASVPAGWRFKNVPVQGGPVTEVLQLWAQINGTNMALPVMAITSSAFGGSVAFNAGGSTTTLNGSTITATGGSINTASGNFSSIVASSGTLYGTGAGALTLKDNFGGGGGASFTNLIFGTTTAAWPALRRVGSGFAVFGGDLVPSPSNHMIVPGTTYSSNGVVSTANFFTTAGTAVNWNSNNVVAGRVKLAAGSQSYWITNALITANAIVFVTVNTEDVTATLCRAIPSAGLLQLKTGAAATADTDLSWKIESP